MKKILIIAVLAGTCGLVRATTINAPSSLGTLEGTNAYSWGVSIAVPTGQSVNYAAIDFTSVTLVASGNKAGTGTLYTDLLNSKTPGVTYAVDNDAAGDYWTTKFSGANIASVGTQLFSKVGQTLTFDYILTQAELNSLNAYLASGSGTFDIGIDPDCKYTVGGLCFTYTLSPVTHNVPDGGLTAFLVVISLASLEFFRRRLVPASCKS